MKNAPSGKAIGLEVSLAVSEAVKLADADVVAAYPITPQTHIVEHLSELVANGELDAQYIPVESEHSAMSACIGSSAAGARTFTATSSQGLALMSEMMFIAPVMRTPIVLALANRALSGPINIWNDHSDVMSIRDCGWIQLFAENGQEALDLTLISFRIAEDPQVMLPVIMNLDGFTLSHFIEPIIIPEAGQVKKYLPPYQTSHKLDVDHPVSMGMLGMPESYTESRRAVDLALLASKPQVVKAFEEFAAQFGRKYNLVETYKTEGAETIIVVMGSIAETAMTAVDEMRADGLKVGLVRPRLWRPFPGPEFRRAVAGAKSLAVIDRHLTLGSHNGPVGQEVMSLLYADPNRPSVSNYTLGLGGRDVSRADFKEVALKAAALSGKAQDRYEMVGVWE